MWNNFVMQQQIALIRFFSYMCIFSYQVLPCPFVHLDLFSCPEHFLTSLLTGN